MQRLNEKEDRSLLKELVRRIDASALVLWLRACLDSEIFIMRIPILAPYEAAVSIIFHNRADCYLAAIGNLTTMYIDGHPIERYLGEIPREHLRRHPVLFKASASFLNRFDASSNR